jgi:hypothetical protein
VEAGAALIDYAVKTTPELTDAEISQLRELFTDVFHKPFPEDVLHRKYSGSCLGYSFHSLMYDEGRVVGAFSAIPVLYRFFGKRVLFAPTADLMIAHRYRGPVKQLQILGKGLFDRLREAGIGFVFACLREEMAMVHQAVSRWRRVGKVFYYLAPANLAARWALRIAPTGVGGPEKWPVEKVNDETFTAFRYGIFPAPYQTVSLAGGGATYTTKPFYPIEGLPLRIRFALLLDVWPLDAPTFDRAVAEIRRREPGLHVIAYQGRLPFRPREMFRVPERFEKKAWWLAGRILREDLIDERVFDIANWNINLSNGDLV